MPPARLATMLITAALFALPIIGCTSHYADGVSALGRGDFPAAQSHASAGLADEPGDGQLLLLMARAQLGLGEYAEAVNSANFALESGDLSNDEQATAHRVATDASLGLGQPSQAARHLLWEGTPIDAIAADYADTPEVLLHLGVLHRRRGAIAESDAAFQAYIDGGPSDIARRSAEVARQLTSLQDWERAIQLLQAAVAADPDLATAHVALIEALCHVADYEGMQTATESYVEWAAQSPQLDAADAFTGAYDALGECGAAEQAMALLERAHTAVHDFEISLRLANAYDRRGQGLRAQEVLAEFVDRAPDPVAAHETLADWLMNHGDPAGAARHYREAADQAEHPADLLLKLAQAYGAAGWPYELVGAVDEHLAASGGGRESVLAAADLLSSHQQWQDAARLLEPLYGSDPTDLEVIVRLGEAAYFSGDPERERSLYREIAAAAADPGALGLQFARVYLDRGAYREAVPWLEIGAQSTSTETEALLELGRAHQMLSQLDAMWQAYHLYLDAAPDRLAAAERVMEHFEGRRFADLAGILLEEMIRQWPEREALRLELAERLLLVGDQQRLEAAYLDYILQASDPVGAAQATVWSLSRRAREDTARVVLERAAASRPELGALSLAAARLYADRANNAAGRGDVAGREEARAAARRLFLAYLDSGQAQAADLVPAAAHMANAGLDDLAVRAYRMAESLGADPALFRAPMAWSLLRSGADAAEALRLFRAAMSSSEDPFELSFGAAEGFAGTGNVGAAVEMAELAVRASDDDVRRARAFDVGAGAAVNDGDLEALRRLARVYVEASADQFSALGAAADWMIEAGAWDAARDYLELAAELLPGHEGLLVSWARLDATEGNLEGAVTRFRALIAGSPESWRAWWAFARFFYEYGDLELAAEGLQQALATPVGASEPPVWVDLGLVSARLGQLDRAIDAFEQALDLVVRNPSSVSRRARFFRQITEALVRAGRPDLAAGYLDRALGDLDLRSSLLLPAAELALARGRNRRALQLMLAFVDGGGSEGEAIDLAIEHGLVEQPLDQLARIALDGDPEAAATLVERHFDRLARQVGARTLDVWIDAIGDRGVDVGELKSRILGWYLRAEDLGGALRIALELAPAAPRHHLIAAALYAASGQIDRVPAQLEQYERLQRPASSPDRSYTETLSAIELTGGGEAVEHALALLADELGSSRQVWAEIAWLLQHGRVDDAQARYMESLAFWSSGATGLFGVVGEDPRPSGIRIFAAAGRTEVATELAEAAGMTLDDVLGLPSASSAGSAGGEWDRAMTAARADEARYEWEAAARAYMAATDVVPGRKEPLESALRSLYRGGEVVEVLAMMARPDLPRRGADSELARLDPRQVRLADPEHALALYERLLQQEPGAFALRVAVMVQAFASGDSARGRRLLIDLEALAPGEPLNRQRILAAMRGLDDIDIVNYARAVAGNPDADHRSRHLAAEVLADAGEVEAAVAAIEAFAEAAPSPYGGRVEAAAFAYDLGDYGAAAELALGALERRSERAEANGLRAAALARLGLSEEARIFSGRYLATAADPTPGIERIAQAYLAAGMEESAEESLLARARAPAMDGEGTVRFPGSALMARVYLESERAADGVRFIDGHFPEAWEHPIATGDHMALVRLLGEAGEAARAADVCRRLIGARPEDPAILTSCSAVLVRGGLPADEAERVWARALAAGRGADSEILRARAALEVALGRPERAREMLRQAVRLLDPEADDFEEQLRELGEQLRD